MQTLPAKALEPSGSSAMTVFKPILDMSLSCSLSETMLLQRESTMVSTWYSLTLLTSGPKLVGNCYIFFRSWVGYKGR